MAEGTTRLAEQQRAQLQEGAQQPRERPPRARLRPAGAGSLRASVRAAGGRRRVAVRQVEGKRAVTQDAENTLRVAQSRLAELDARLSQRIHAGQRASWRAAGRNWPTCASSTTRQMREISNTEDKLRLQGADRAPGGGSRRAHPLREHRQGQLPADPGAGVGVITDVTSTQRGDKMQANSPLGGIAPKDAQPVLRIEIAERDRAFLREGLPVKLKFNAFPYQRYGLIAGTLEYISPATKPSLPDKQPVYEGACGWRQDYYAVAEYALSAALRHDRHARRSWCASGA